ncbi:hypothetical protein GCM10007904_31390 [Oharaeibacter diazotrophicus]|nr:hypothetical protein GCM10007904_31390 [Oharaeibacter diazotrophicus]
MAVSGSRHAPSWPETKPGDEGATPTVGESEHPPAGRTLAAGVSSDVTMRCDVDPSPKIDTDARRNARVRQLSAASLSSAALAAASRRFMILTAMIEAS